MKDFKTEIESALYLLDNKPLEDFDGLSRADMRYLVHNPFSKDSPLSIRHDISNRIIDQMLIMRPFELFLKRSSQTKYIRLTKKGFLPTALVKEVDDSIFRSKDYLFVYKTEGLYSEKDSHTACMVRYISEKCGFIERQNNKLLFSPQWKESFLAGDRQRFFRSIFRGYTQYYNWINVVYNDNPNTGQEGFAYTLYLLSKYGKYFKPLSFYTNKYFRAFPLKPETKTIEDYDLTATIVENAHWGSPNSAFEIATFESFLVRFNLVNYQFVQKQNSNRQLLIKKSRAFDKVLTFI